MRCIVCDAVYGNAQEHRCPFKGVEHANKHRETERRIISLENEVAELRATIHRLDESEGK